MNSCRWTFITRPKRVGAERSAVRSGPLKRIPGCVRISFPDLERLALVELRWGGPQSLADSLASICEGDHFRIIVVPMGSGVGMALASQSFLRQVGRALPED